MDKIKLIIWVFVIGGMILKPFFKRRKAKAEEEARKRSAAARKAAAARAEEPDDDQDEPMLPYEDLVQEVFGDHIARRREKARPAPPSEPSPRLAPSRMPAETQTAPESPPEPVSPAPDPVPDSLAGKSRLVRAASPAEAPSRRRSVEEQLFGQRRLSPTAKLIIAAEILRPPRVLRARGRFWNR